MSEVVYQAKRPVSQFAPGGVANRVTATTDGTLMTMQQVTQSLAAGAITGRGATKVVASSGATAVMKAAADYLCDGTADDVEINAALNALPAAGGTVVLSEGTFTIAAPIVFNGAFRTLRGMSVSGTNLFVVSNGGTPVNNYMVQMNAHYVTLSDLAVYGNKANNAAQTNMTLVATYSAVSPLIQRVLLSGSAGHGLVTLGTTQNVIVRDCLIELSVNHNVIARSAAGQPTVFSGCTSKGSSQYGFVCDDGPITFSDCHALSNAGDGFHVSTTSPVAINHCTAQANTGTGFRTIGTRTIFTACQAVGNTVRGFSTNGVAASFIGCVARSSTSGDGFRSEASSTDTTYAGCLALDNGSYGFTHVSSGKATYAGCRAINNTQYGFLATLGTVFIRGCVVYGPGAAGGIGIGLNDGTGHVVAGCRILNHGAMGIYVNGTIPNVQIVNNTVSNSSLTTNSGYNQISMHGDDGFIHGNLLRDPGAGNRPWGGIILESDSNNTFLGHNDAQGVGNAYEIYNAGTNARRIIKLQLEYVASTDLLDAVATSSWIDVTANQTFQVSKKGSYVEIACWGRMQTGNTGYVAALYMCRLVINAATTPIYKQIGGAASDGTTTYQNPLAGAQPVRLTILTPGSHTVKLQVMSNVASISRLRAASFPDYEFLTIQVTEFAR